MDLYIKGLKIAMGGVSAYSAVWELQRFLVTICVHVRKRRASRIRVRWWIFDLIPFYHCGRVVWPAQRGG